MWRREGRRWLKIAVLAAIIPTIAVVLFFIWASSGTLPSRELSVIRNYPGLEAPSGRKTHFTVMTYNIGYLSGGTNNLPVRRPGREFFQSNLEGVLAVLRKTEPDIIAFQEIDFFSRRSHYIDQLDVLARRGHYPHTVSAVNWDKRFVPFPYWPPGVQFGRMLSGQAVASRCPVGEARRLVLAKPANNPFFYNAFYLDRLVQVVTVSIGDRSLFLLNVHLEAFDIPAKEDQARELLRIYRDLRRRFPVIILGDLNSVPPDASRKFGFKDEPGMDFRADRTMAILLSERTLAASFMDHGTARPECEIFTFPADDPSRKLDYVLYDREKIEMIEARTIRIESSDHLPLLVRFRFKTLPVPRASHPDRAERG